MRINLPVSAPIQNELRGLVADVSEERRMLFRIGVHLGDVIEKADGTVYGDGVNIAARLEGLVEPGGIMISESVRTAVKGKIGARCIETPDGRATDFRAIKTAACRIDLPSAEAAWVRSPALD